MAKDEEHDDATKLADRLSKRSGEEPSKKARRLGNRLRRHLEGMEEEEEEEKEEKPKLNLPEDIDSSADFLETFRELADRYPELREVSFSDLKKVISQIGMKHPEEVAELLRNDRQKEEIRENKRKYITH